MAGEPKPAMRPHRPPPWVTARGAHTPHPLWHGLQLATAQQADTGRAVDHVLEALRGLATAREALGPVLDEQAQLLLDALTTCSSATTPATPCSLTAGLALQLLARWAFQRRGLSGTARTVLQRAVAWVVDRAALLANSPTPHTSAAAVLFLGAALQGCRDEEGLTIMAAVCVLMETGGPGAPLGALAATQDACTGCELVLQHCGSQTAALRVAGSFVAGACTAALGILAEALGGHGPDLWAHIPLLAIASRSPAGPERRRHGGGLPPEVLAPLGSLLPLSARAACSTAMRVLARAGQVFERWAAAVVRGLTPSPSFRNGAGNRDLTPLATLQEVAAQLQALCIAGLAPARGGYGQRGPVTATPRNPIAAVCLSLASWRRDPGPVAPSWQRLPATAPHQLRPPGAMETLWGPVAVSTAVVAAASLMLGTVRGLRDAPPASRASIRAQLHALLPALAGAIQPALAATCKRVADGDGCTAVEKDPGHVLMTWAVGYTHGCLAEPLAAQGLLQMVAVPGPLSAQMPVRVLDCLLGCTLDLEPLLLHAMAGEPPGWVHALLSDMSGPDDPLTSGLPVMARSVISVLQPGSDPAGGDARSALQQGVLRVLCDYGRLASNTYSAVTLTAPPGWLDAAGGTSGEVRSLLERVYVVVGSVLAALYTGWPAGGVAHVVASLLDVAARLHFCAVPLPALQGAQRAMMAQMLDHPSACQVYLDTCLPCYEALLEAAGSPHRAIAGSAAGASSGNGSATVQVASHGVMGPRWLVDDVLAARLLAVLPTAAAAASRARDALKAAHQVLPYLFLLLKHPQVPIASAAHAALASLVSHLASGGGGQADALPAQVLPYYLQRSLQLPWELGQLEALERGLPALLATLPPGSSAALAGMRALIDSAAGWYEAHPGAPPLDFTPLYMPHQNLSQHPREPAADPAAPSVAPEAKLVSMACQLLLLADWQLLPAVAEDVGHLVAGAGAHGAPGQQVVLLQFIHDLLLRSDDYVRKRQLAEWLQCLVRAPKQDAAVADVAAGWAGAAAQGWLRWAWGGRAEGAVSPETGVPTELV